MKIVKKLEMAVNGAVIYLLRAPIERHNRRFWIIVVQNVLKSDFSFLFTSADPKFSQIAKLLNRICASTHWEQRMR